MERARLKPVTPSFQVERSVTQATGSRTYLVANRGFEDPPSFSFIFNYKHINKLDLINKHISSFYEYKSLY